MAQTTVNTSVSVLYDSQGASKSVLVQNVGTGGLWVDVGYGPNSTVTSSTGVYVGIGSTVPVEVFQGRLLAISNGTSDVRYC